MSLPGWQGTVVPFPVAELLMAPLPARLHKTETLEDGHAAACFYGRVLK
jgi:hypothetical protein